MARTRGYPFFIQEWGSQAWEIAEGDRITAGDAEASHDAALASLDQGFFRVRIDQLTRGETGFVKTMSDLGDGPYAMSAVAEAMGRSQTSLAPLRASIIRKGMIYSPVYGYVDFTVPLFGAFLQRRDHDT